MEKPVIDQLRSANAGAFAAYTQTLISSSGMSEREAIKKTIGLMIRKAMEICDYRIVEYLKMLEK